MKHRVLSVLALSVSVSAFADDSVQYQTLSLPAEDILNATLQIQPQTSPFYSVHGTLFCLYKQTVHNAGTKLCSVKVDNKDFSIANVDALFNELVKVKPELGQFHGFFEAPFSAQKINSEFPPYGIKTSATVYLKRFLPEDNILNAVQKIVPKTSPGYFVNGVLSCTENVQKTPPMGDYLHISECSVQVNGKTEKVENPWGIVSVLHETYPLKAENWDGAPWSFHNHFTASSISREFPPYTTAQQVEVQLYR